MKVNTKRDGSSVLFKLTVTFILKQLDTHIPPVVNGETFLPIIVVVILRINSIEKRLEIEGPGCGFEPYRRHCVKSLSKTHQPLLSTGSTQEDASPT